MTDRTDLASEIADFIGAEDHDRPFWRDPGFIAEFGGVQKSDLEAAVDELWQRSESKARTARAIDLISFSIRRQRQFRARLEAQLSERKSHEHGS